MARLVLTSPALLANTFVPLARLSHHPGDDALDHRKSVRTCLRFSAGQEIVLHGVLLYTANDKEILDLTVPVLFDRVTSTVKLYREEQLLTEAVTWISHHIICYFYKYLQSEVTTAAEARRRVSSPHHIPHTQPLRFPQPLRLERDVHYDLEVVLYPTDVSNHYSGAPITLCGAEIWTCHGRGGKLRQSCHGVSFRSTQALQVLEIFILVWENLESI